VGDVEVRAAVFGCRIQNVLVAKVTTGACGVCAGLRIERLGVGVVGAEERSNTSVLPRLKDSKVMGVADEDAPEEPQRQESIVGGCAGESFLGVCVCEKGHLGDFK